MPAETAPIANVITLGVSNFDAQRDFYRRLGWPLVLDSDDFAVFELRGSLLALFPVDKLAADGRAGLRLAAVASVSASSSRSTNPARSMPSPRESARRAASSRRNRPMPSSFRGAMPISRTRKATSGRSRGRRLITPLS